MAARNFSARPIGDNEISNINIHDELAMVAFGTRTLGYQYNTIFNSLDLKYWFT
jgi:hypothetical protein